MLRGRIGNTTSRPFIEGQLSIQSIGIESEKVSFLADTGADVGLLAPVDSTRLGVDYTRCTPNPEPVAGVGGETRDTYFPPSDVIPAHAVTLFPFPRLGGGRSGWGSCFHRQPLRPTNLRHTGESRQNPKSRTGDLVYVLPTDR